MCLCSRLKYLFKSFLRVNIDVDTDKQAGGVKIKDSKNVKVIIGSSPVPTKKTEIALSDLEKRILVILSEGGHAVPALDATGCVMQVNIYGHPEQDSVDCIAPETLSAYRALLRRGLIAEDFSTGKREYIVTEKGSSICDGQ